MENKQINKIINNYFAEGIDNFLPNISINCVVLGYESPHLKVLVHKLPDFGEWMLPGGYVNRTESISDAAYRNLNLSGINQVFLRQILTVGDAHRVHEISVANIDETLENRKVAKWASQRFVTIVYYGLVNLASTEVVPGGLLGESKWLNVDHLETLFMDHARIITETRTILSIELLNHPVASNLLPETFTLTELRGLFEAILNRNIDRGTFRRKILKLGIIEQTEKTKDVKGQPTYLYKFNSAKYQQFLQEQTKFGF
ncbi:hypothetical protein [uncultured Draconibacterium sp.]|uniref:NUDIX hydrolase n=1 Tax=uncultured Draconibacterium sp. TaxID=1573823 RepID=UPI003216969C